jgi:hypothetical protein
MAPFVQVDRSLSRKHEGTGLGLPLTKRMIELHGGRLEIESEPGVGTKATLVFPLSRIVRPGPQGDPGAGAAPRLAPPLPRIGNKPASEPYHA